MPTPTGAYSSKQMKADGGGIYASVAGVTVAVGLHDSNFEATIAASGSAFIAGAAGTTFSTGCMCFRPYATLGVGTPPGLPIDAGLAKDLPSRATIANLGFGFNDLAAGGGWVQWDDKSRGPVNPDSPGVNGFGDAVSNPEIGNRPGNFGNFGDSALNLTRVPRPV